MNFCLPYMKSFPHNDEIPEFTIKYNSLKDSYEDLVKFIETYSDRRINIELLHDATGADTILPLLKINPEIYLKLNESYIQKVTAFKEKGIRFFFSLQSDNWDSFNSLVNIGVSDIYIANELGFSLLTISKILKNKNIHIRVIVNIAQARDPFESTEPIKAFFIRPEDIDDYETYIDTIEFFADNQVQYEVLYETYAYNKNWDGNLQEIIIGLRIPIDSRTIIPEFGLYRGNCEKRCFRGSNCAICNRVVELSETMASRDIMFAKNRVADELK